MTVLPKTPSFRLDGRRALVVGATSGIGLAAAAALAEAGAEVTLAARGADRLSDLCVAIEAAGGRAVALPLDIARVEETEETLEIHGPYDVLVNSAGTARHGSVTETKPGDFDAVSDLNFRGAYFLTRAVARGLIAAGRPGSLINISSQMGHVGGPDRAVYCATKHAVEGFTRAMAVELGPHDIRVNTICPTFIRTPLSEPSLSRPATRSWIEDRLALPRIGEVEDVMGAVVFLASDASALVTGSALMVDGGWTAQ